MTEITLKKGTGKPAESALVEAEFALDVSTGTIYSKLSDGKVRALNDAEFIGIDANADNYQYWQYKIDGFNTTSVMSTSFLNFQSGDGIQIDKEGYGIKISATGTGGGGGSSLWEQNGSDIYYNDGHIGVGVDTPIAVIHAERTQAGARLVQLDRDDNSVGIDVATGASGGWGLMDYNRGDYDLFMKNGNVGIGVSDQKESLEVGGPVIARGGLTQGHRTDCGVFQHTVGDGHTRIRSYGTNAGEGFITFDVGGGGNTKDTEAMRIDASGNVGIGDDNPTAVTSNATTLEIKGTVTTKGGAIKLNSSDESINSFIYPDATNGLSINMLTAHPMRFLTSGTERMRIDALGNVGIGTSNATPSNGAGLCVGSGSTVTRIDMRNIITGDATGDGASLQLNGNNFTIENREAGYVAFSTSLTERMRIDADGNVGIKSLGRGSRLYFSTDTNTGSANAFQIGRDLSLIHI